MGLRRLCQRLSAGLGLALALLLAHAEQPEPRTLHVITDENYPPYLFRNDDGSLAGYLVDYWALWQRKTGVAVKLTGTRWQEAQQRVLAGEADLIDMMYRTPEREKLYDFSTPYAALAVNIYKHQSIAGIAGSDALQGFKLGVQAGDACIEALASRGLTTLVPYGNYAELLAGAQRGEHRVFCLDQLPADFYLHKLGLQDDYRKAFTLYTGQFHRAAPKGRTEVLQQVERGMAAISRKELQELQDKWFGQALGVPAAAPADYRRLVLGLAALACLSLLAGLWVRLLRRQVAARTRDLQCANAQLTTQTQALLRSEQQLRSSQARLRTLVDTLPDLVWLKDPQGVYLACNRRFEQLHGLSEAEIVGKTDHELLPQQLADRNRARDRVAVESGAATVHEDELIFRSDGHAELLQTIQTPVVDPGGALVGVLGVGRDVTELRSTALQLQEHQQQLEQLVQQRTSELAVERRRLNDILTGTDAGSWEWSVPTGEVMYNERWAQMLGYTLQELAPISFATWERLAHAEDLPRAVAQLQLHLAGTLPLYEYEMRMRHKSGAWVWVLTRGKVALRGEQGQPLLVSGIHLDVSARKHAELELQQAKDAAEAAARAKSSFLTHMSHEIRTPLNGVLGLAQLGWRESSGHPRSQATFGRILDSGRLLLAIVNDILDLSKIEAGKLVIEELALDPSQLVDDTLQGMAVLAADKGIAIRADKAGLPPAVLGDPLRIAQVLFNLLSNALKFTERGEIRLCARAENGRLSFVVHDTGVGIEPQALERLFQPFEQADASFTRKYGGTGLGLAISRRLAELMGGSLEVQSVLGQGSSFTLHLPLRPCAAAAAERPAREPGARRLAGLRLLLAEDNEVNQLVLGELLRSEGAEVLVVADGRQAVEAATSGPDDFDAVLMDVQMPVMDGLQAAAMLRLRRPGLPVVGQTAHALKEELDRCREAGMVATLPKPVDLELLVQTLLGLVQRRPEPAAAAAQPGASAKARPT